MTGIFTDAIGKGALTEVGLDELPNEYVRECPALNFAFRRENLRGSEPIYASFAYGSDVDFSCRLNDGIYWICFVFYYVVATEWGTSSGSATWSYLSR